MPKPKPLNSGLIARKGDAARGDASNIATIPRPATTPAAVAVATPEGSPAHSPTQGEVSTDIGRTPLPKGTAGTIAVTVRLDEARYRRLKLHGLDHRKSNQEILVNALDVFLSCSDPRH